MKRLAILLAIATPAILPCRLPAQASAFLQSAGQVVVHRADLISPGTTWTYALKGAVTMPLGGDLAVTFSVGGGFATGSQADFRLLVDDVEQSSATLFRALGTSRHVSYDFFARNLAAGPHRVAVQVRMPAGGGTLSDRSMVMRFATPTSDDLRLAYRRAPFATRSAGGYVDVPGATVDVDCPWSARLQISATGEYHTTANRRIFVRIVAGGVVSHDVLQICGPTTGIRGHTFTTGVLPRGRHTVKLQWLAEDTASLGNSTLLVTAVRDAINYETGFFHQRPSSGPSVQTTSTTFQPIPGLEGGLIFVPSRCDLAIRVGGEAACDPGTYFRIRCTVDGTPTPDGADRRWFYGETMAQGACETVFVARNLERGWHDIDLSWASSDGRTIDIGDRTLTATAIIGQRPLLVTATESDRPAGYPYGGRFASSVVDVIGASRVFKSYVADNFWRNDPGVADWFAEQARGHMHLVEAVIVGPNLKYLREDLYRSRPNPFTEMKIEALQFADAVFDFSYYDRDGDGSVRPDELYGLVVFYQDSVFGEVRSIPAIPTNDGVMLDYSSGVATVYTPDFVQRSQLGVIDHELSHLLLNAGDMYETSWDPTAPGPFSIMDQHGWNGHLDPLHKLKQGRWFESYAMTSDRWIELTPVSSGGSILRLHDPASHPGEYFLVENRAVHSYDAALPTHGLAIWHCDESRLPDWRTAVELEHASGPQNPVIWSNVLFTGMQRGFAPERDFWQNSTGVNSRWHDGSPSAIGVWGIHRRDDGSMRLFVDVPGPGVLAQFEHAEVPVGPYGTADLRIRIVNTDFASDTFNVAVQGNCQASWTSRNVALGGYGSTVLNLTVTPNAQDIVLTVTARGSGGQTSSDTTQIRMTLIAPSTIAVGGSADLQARYPEHAGETYAMAASTGNGGIWLTGGIYMPLDADPLFFTSWTTPTIFQNFLGVLDPAGEAQARLLMPALPVLRGFTFHFAYATIDSSLAFTGTSNGVAILVQ